MSAVPERTVLASIPNGKDRELRVSLISFPAFPDVPPQLGIEDYIPSRDLYGRGIIFDETHRTKIMAGLRAAAGQTQ